MSAGTPPSEQPVADGGETVGELAELYLGNLLYALELAALSLEERKQPDAAAFYRGIGRKLAEARGQGRTRATPRG